jgi:hypothetical protein
MDSNGVAGGVARGVRHMKPGRLSNQKCRLLPPIDAVRHLDVQVVRGTVGGMTADSRRRRYKRHEWAAAPTTTAAYF